MRILTNKKYYSVLSLMTFFIISSLLATTPSQAADELCKPSSGKVARAMFTTTIADREPANRVLILENNTSLLYFFSDLRHLEGRTVTHRWEYEGRVVNEKTFQVKGARWRVYSKHKIDHNMLGRWTAVVTDEDGCPLKAVIFQYVQTGQEGSAIVDLN